MRRGIPWLALGLILLGALAGFGHLLSPGEFPYSRFSDFLAYHLAGKTVLFDSVRDGLGIPFWRGDQLGGFPALTNPQAAYTYPLHFLFYVLDPVAALGPTDFLHFLAAGLMFFLLGVALRVGFWPRLLIAFAGMFGFKLLMATFAGWLAMVPSLVFIPGLLAAVLWTLETPGPAGAIAVALAGALCLHAGQVQLLAYAAGFIVPYVLVVTGRLAWARQGRAACAAAGWCGLGAVLAAGLSMLLLLPLAADGRLATRAQGNYEFLGAGREQPAHLATFLDPEALGTPLDDTYVGSEIWEETAYFGIVPLVLAVLAVLFARRRRATVFLGVAFAVSVLLAFDTPLLRLIWQVVPGFRLFRIPARFLFLGSIFGVALSGIGLDEFLARARQSGPAARRIATGVAIAAVLATVAEGTWHARRYLVMAPNDTALPSPALKDFFAQDRSLFRVAPVGRSTINAGWAAPLGVQLVTGFDAFNTRHYATYFDLMVTGDVQPPQARVWFDLPSSLARLDLLDALNVKYVVAPAPLPGRPPQELVATFRDQPTFQLYRGIVGRDLYVYRNPGWVERATWAREPIVVRDLPAMTEAVRANDLHRHTVVMCPGDPEPYGVESPDDRVDVASARPGTLAIRSHADAPRLLVVSETWNPAWRVTIDDREASACQANLALIGIPVPRGDHDIRLTFVPPCWELALGITAGSAGLLLVLAFVAVSRSRRRAAPVMPPP